MKSQLRPAAESDRETLVDQAVRDGRDVTLAVAAVNTRARRLYERLGFTPVGSDGPLIHATFFARPFG